MSFDFKNCCLLLLSFSLLTACGENIPTSYYVLNSNTHSPAEELKNTNTKRMPKILLQEVSIPSYLDRDAMVNRSASEVEVDIADYDSWAEGLDVGIQRVLGDVLMGSLLEHKVALLSMDSDGANARKLYVFIRRFDGQLNGSVYLDARWTLHNSEQKAIASGAFVDSANAGSTHASMVMAQSALLVNFAKEITVPVARAARKK